MYRIIFNSDFLKKYKKEIDNLIEDTESENENKFGKIYYPEEHKNELYIYKKNLFLNIGNPNFDKIYELISKDIKTPDKLNRGSFNPFIFCFTNLFLINARNNYLCMQSIRFLSEVK